MNFLSWLETSAVANWVALSLWAYPMLLSLHIIGLAVVVGIFSMRDLRLLGLVDGPQLVSFIPLARLAFIGFGLNALSGLLLFTSQATFFIVSIPFLLKISAITLGMILALSIQSRLRAEQSGHGTLRDARPLAALSLLCWAGAIIAGRLIAYF